MNMHVKPDLCVGAKVRVTHTDYPDHLPVGTVTTIARIDYDGDVWLKYDAADEDGLFFYRSEFEPTPAFSVGDRVRYSDDYVTGVGTVAQVEGDDTYLVAIEGKDKDKAYFLNKTARAFRSTQIEPAPKFAVGDRVRFVVNAEGDNNEVIDKTGTITGACTSCYDWTVTLDEYSEYGHTGDGDIPYGYGRYAVDADLEPVAVAPATATPANSGLRIEAGKYYKTRDGRKVGPMVVGTFGAWDKGHTYTSMQWEFDGTFIRGAVSALDLIAEWPAATYHSCAAAEVDNLADEYGPVVKAKFKVGDRVRAVHSSAFSVKKGDVFVVTGVNGDEIQFVSNNGEPDGWSQENFELAPDRPAIVARIDNGQPLPATRPYVHGDHHAATAEALRLAEANPGKEFGVYELVDTRKVEPKHEWQRLAMAGKHTAAVDELMRHAGIDRTTAAWAVDTI